MTDDNALRSTDSLTITRPDDWHLHVRDGLALRTVVPHSARQFARAVIMPNLKPPVTTVAQAMAYAQRIRAAVPQGAGFEPLMTLYLTDNLDPDEILRASATRCWLNPSAEWSRSTSAAICAKLKNWQRRRPELPTVCLISAKSAEAAEVGTRLWRSFSTTCTGRPVRNPASRARVTSTPSPCAR